MITQDYVKERLSYDPDTGIFVWKRRPGFSRSIKAWNTRYAGKVAGCVYNSHGRNLFYVKTTIDNVRYDCHALAWYYCYGEWPLLLDHIDGVGTNNKISNLRPLSHGDNIRKGRIQSNNTSGFKGVSFRRDTERWTARLKVDGKYKSLGSYSTKEEAFAVYCAKVLEITGEIHLHLIQKEEEDAN